MNRLKELREERGYSTRSMEIKTGINYNSICRYENETRDFNTGVLRQLSDFFQVSIDYLLCHSNCFVYANYELDNFTFKIRDDYYKELKGNNYIYFKDDKRYVDLNKIFNIDKDNNLLPLIIEFARVRKADELFDRKNVTSADIEDLKSEIIDIELNKSFIEMIKDAIRF
ncbi:MAG: helix-turn-helix transcriptional regulator [Acholeplasmatales bacterium]|nr:helix-turn-helix transcriptional regulator [Acholeplasmatales bacterium]